MTIDFYIRYSTRFGQTFFLSGNIDELGNDKPAEALALTYLNNEFWFGTIEIADETEAEINYRYILREEGSVDILDGDKDRVVDLNRQEGNQIVVIDTWNSEGDFGNAFYTKPFLQVLLPAKHKIPKLKEAKSYTHEFKVKAPLLHADELVCITGSGKMFNNWDVKNLSPLKQANNWYSIKINFSKEDFPLRYKYEIYNTKSKTFT